ncbi:uncharacterized protein [Aegilops tauschii subsp. strangulata]|uniref:uncharacterized protein n=1 Tax=Aegilops tauschii subsp. strangulata TaxID=200361 RepID=UPI00098A0459|nr:putative F-box protein At3g16210 [Aegilops tauschii subsp. strangulata]
MDSRTSSPAAAAAAPLLPDDLLLEILLRLPPEPIYLFRASFVSKHWRGLVHDAGFLRRFRDFHGGTPPVIGFLRKHGGPPLFLPTSGGFAVSTPTMSDVGRSVLDCRHGRALLHCRRSSTLLVWDPMTTEEHYLPLPTLPCPGDFQCNAVVLCAADHADHNDCHSRPFLMHDSYVRGEPRPPLVGNTLYWLLANHHIVGFDLDKHSFDLVEKVPHVYYQTILVSAEDELGCAGVDGFSLHFWSRVASIDGAVTWTRRRVVDLEKLLAAEVVAACMLPVEPVGYAEDADVIFIYVDPGTYMIRLKSMQITEVSDKGPYTHIFPYTSFYTPGITGGAGEDQAELLNGT